jgi:hypothetical protein
MLGEWATHPRVRQPQRYVLSSQFTIVFTNHFDLTKTTALVPKALTIAVWRRCHYGYPVASPG